VAAITFDTAPQKGASTRLTPLAAFREMLDAFVSNRMRQAAAEARACSPQHAVAIDKARYCHAADRPTDISGRQVPRSSAAAIGRK